MTTENREYSLGIDTSNYKTSVAITDREENVIYDKRILLSVKKGERGLRQQEAVFQHINNLPGLIEEAMDVVEKDLIGVVSASVKPRPVKESYMPCFTVGEGVCRIIASSLKIPFYFFSHQEGHIAAAKSSTELNEDEYIAFHFSGGTSEALKIDKEDKITKIGGTLDIAFGQLIDRIGVAIGLRFPAGEKIDEFASLKSPFPKNLLPSINLSGFNFNLSGIETAALKLAKEIPDKELSYMLFQRITEIIIEEIKMINHEKGIRNFLFTGGVSESQFLKEAVVNEFLGTDINIFFSEPNLSSDNAVGISLLGGKKIWQ